MYQVYGVDNASEDISRLKLHSNLNVLFAVSKGIRTLELCCSKTLGAG